MRNWKINLVPPPVLHNPAVHQRYPQREYVASRAPEAEAARTTGVRGNGAAYRRCDLGRIRCVKLSCGNGRISYLEKIDGGPGANRAFPDFEPLELLKRNYPAALRNPATGQPGACSAYRDR